MSGRQEANGRLVESRSQVDVNIRTLESARNSQDVQLRKGYEDLIRDGICFLAYPSSSGIAFAPSKFIGYVNNDFATHFDVRNRERHGGKTNRAIAKLFGAPELNSSAEESYRDFCRVLGFEPKESATFNRPRKYWMTNEVLDAEKESAEEAIVSKINSDQTLSATEKDQLVKARLGQGRFRAELIVHWHRCCLTGCDTVELLRASHIKPWSESDNVERLDKYNGLLLTPNADALFDQGLISFCDDGKMLISKRLSNEDAELLLSGCEERIEGLSRKHKRYLEWHRRRYGFENATPR